METTLKKLTTEKDLRLLEPLYTASFPEYEAKPFEMIVNGVHSGSMEAYAFYAKDQKPAALAFLIQDDRAMLLDYLAVDPDFQSSGLGSRMIAQLSKIYEAPLIVEIESTHENVEEEEMEIRRRRKSFYLRNGFLDDEIRIRLFGVDMELMSTRKKIAFEDYFQIIGAYLENFGIRAAKNVLNLSESQDEAD